MVAPPPLPPDYSQYISTMSNIASQLQAYGGDLFAWAKAAGVDLSKVAGQVSQRAASQAGWGTRTARQAYTNWQKTYGPIYQAQAARTLQYMKDLPATQEQWAGQYGSSTAQAFDASRAAAQRKLESYGLSEPSIGSAAIDATTRNQRAAAVTASANQGRMAAMQYGDTLTGQTLASGQVLPQVSGQQSNVGLGYGAQQIAAPATATSTTAGAYAPGLQAFNTAYPYQSAWGNTMLQGYNQILQGYNTYTNAQLAQNQQSSGWGALFGSLLGGAAQLGGAYLGNPAAFHGFEEGGAIGTFAGAGNVVPPQVSPSGGRKTDDVPVPIMDGGQQVGNGAINVGEFIWPKDVVAWRGEQWMQKEIQKARKERAEQTVAAPEKVPVGQAFSTGQPMRAAA